MFIPKKLLENINMFTLFQKKQLLNRLTMGNRREFLKVSLAASAGVAICGCSRNGSTAKIFDDSERNCLIAISEQIVPADEQWGGATEAGVINYIENWVGKYYPEMLPIYKRRIGCPKRLAKALLQKLSGARI